MKQKTDTSKIAKAVVDEIERRQVENEPLSPSASIWFILVVMNLLIRRFSFSGKGLVAKTV